MKINIFKTTFFKFYFCSESELSGGEIGAGEEELHNTLERTEKTKHSGVLGLFETIAQQNSAAQQNFEVTRLSSPFSAVENPSEQNRPNTPSEANPSALDLKMRELQEKMFLEQRLEEIKQKELKRIEERERQDQLRLEQARREEQTLLEERSKLEELKRYQEMKEQEEKRLEKLRQIEEDRRIEEQRRAEERKRFDEQRRLEEEQRTRDEERRIEEAKRLEKQQKLEEERRKEAEKRKADEERRIAEQKWIEEERRKDAERRKLAQLERLEQEEKEQQERYKELQEKLRLQQEQELKAAEEDLRNQQREKLRIFNLEKLFEEQKEVHEKQKELNQTPPPPPPPPDKEKKAQKQKIFPTQVKVEEPEVSGPNPGTNPGVAFASITIEEVGDSRDYEVNGGIVKLKRGNGAGAFNPAPVLPAPSLPEYEYEYYEADADDVRFHQGAALAPPPTQDNLDSLSNKELLLKLLHESNNFQNEEFLGRLKQIILDKDTEENGVEQVGSSSSGLVPISGQGSVTLLDSDRVIGQHDQFLRSIDGGNWAPSASVPGSKDGAAEEKGPVWPSMNSLNPPKDDGIVGNSFLPSKQVHTGTGRKNETEIIFVVLLQINWNITNLVLNTHSACNYEH